MPNRRIKPKVIASSIGGVGGYWIGAAISNALVAFGVIDESQGKAVAPIIDTIVIGLSGLISGYLTKG